MNDSETLWITPYASIRIRRISFLSIRAELCLWPAGVTGISVIGHDRHEALQRLEKQIRGLADAVPGTFSHEAYNDE